MIFWKIYFIKEAKESQAEKEEKPDTESVWDKHEMLLTKNCLLNENL